MGSSLLWALALLLALANGQGNYYEPEIQLDESKHSIQFFDFVTRPDIDAPMWKMTVYNESAVAPGFWFVAPYGIVHQTHNSHAYVGPHIYDSQGALIWSGSKMFKHFNSFSFRVSPVAGEDMLTLLYPRTNQGRIIDNTYKPYKAVHTSRHGFRHNIHEFQIVDDGKRALFIVGSGGTSVANADKLGIEEGRRCRLVYQGIEERDIESGNVTFAWSAQHLIHPDESYMWEEDVKELCGTSDHNNSDYMHLNSVEKLANGDYLVSSRRAWAIYLVTKEGKIAWRLGGKKSDFTLAPGLHWSGQHDVRCLEQNNTHLILSLLDNAKISGAFPVKSNNESRGLVISVNTEAMTAAPIAEYVHPTHHFAESRGNFQTLPNGNALIFWTHDALNSEYAPDGTLLKTARFRSGLKTYRGYKFSWVAYPTEPPTVHSQLLTLNEQQTTVVHVSWNGATEVASWNLYRTDADGNGRDGLLSTPRNGFETALLYAGHAEFVVVEGLDRDGKALGESAVFATLQTPSVNDTDLSDKPLRLHHLEQQQQAQESAAASGGDENAPSSFTPPTSSSSPSSSPTATSTLSPAIAGILFTCAAVASFWFSRRLWSQDRERRKRATYTALRNADDEARDDEGLLDHYAAEERKRRQNFALDEIGSKNGEGGIGVKSD